MAQRAVTAIGAASSAGAHHAGQEHAPAALRAAGFLSRLREAGIDAADAGDAAQATFAPDGVDATARNLPAVVRAANMVADAVERTLAEGRLAALTGGAGGIAVHFDVDAVDSRDLPLGNFPRYGTGVPLTTAAEVLAAWYRSPRLRAVALTEVNPGYEPSGAALARYVDAVAGALAAGLAG